MKQRLRNLRRLTRSAIATSSHQWSAPPPPPPPPLLLPLALLDGAPGSTCTEAMALEDWLYLSVTVIVIVADPEAPLAARIPSVQVLVVVPQPADTVRLAGGKRLALLLAAVTLRGPVPFTAKLTGVDAVPDMNS